MFVAKISILPKIANSAHLPTLLPGHRTDLRGYVRVSARAVVRHQHKQRHEGHFPSNKHEVRARSRTGLRQIGGRVYFLGAKS